MITKKKPRLTSSPSVSELQIKHNSVCRDRYITLLKISSSIFISILVIDYFRDIEIALPLISVLVLSIGMAAGINIFNSSGLDHTYIDNFPKLKQDAVKQHAESICEQFLCLLSEANVGLSVERVDGVLRVNEDIKEVVDYWYLRFDDEEGQRRALKLGLAFSLHSTIQTLLNEKLVIPQEAFEMVKAS